MQLNSTCSYSKHIFYLQFVMFVLEIAIPNVNSFTVELQSTFSTQNPRASDGHVASRIARHDWLRSNLCKHNAKKPGQICFERLEIFR